MQALLSFGHRHRGRPVKRGEPVVLEPVEELLRGQRPDPSGGQLERQGYAVEQGTEAAHRS